jgi:myo-inositol-1(or 4)-monophosphatase
MWAATKEIIMDRQIGARSNAREAIDGDIALLDRMVAIVTEAGERLLEVFTPGSRPAGRTDMLAAGRRNEEVSVAVLRPALAAARPEAGWVGEDQETLTLPPGEWWTVDAVEGNVNHLHGLPEWAVTATLIRDNEPVLATMRQPVGDLTYTARKSGGAWRNGQRLESSTKTELRDAIVATGQAEAGQQETYQRIGASLTVMLSRALLVRATVPSTFPMLLVAEGHIDGFWQYEPVLPGVAGGALLVREAGGVVTDGDGRPWQPGASTIVAAASGVHRSVVDALF